jgi:hypothetical protein
MKKKQNLLIGLAVVVGFGGYKIYESLVTRPEIEDIQRQNDSCYKDRPNNDTTSIIIYKEQITTADLDSLNKWGLTKTWSCPCDSNLQLWGDTMGVPIFGHDGLAHSGDQKPGGGSGKKGRANILAGEGFKVSPNYIVITPDTSASTSGKNISAFPPTKTAQNNLIGVMDSGIKSNNIWTNLEEIDDNIDNDVNGLKNDQHGWNFLNLEQGGSNDIYPPNTHTHGTEVTYLIERELQENKNYRIVPMVVLYGNKEGRLFNVLCAMAYATRIKNLRTLNASLGYYGHKSKVLEIMIEKLKKANIMLVTAAGNADPLSDSCEVVYGKNPRDLASRNHKFYPAAYAKDCTNVIAATTVFKDTLVGKKGSPSQQIKITKVAPKQNYSSQYVDVGVMGDRKGDFRFENVDSTNPPFYYSWGTSYAAPVVTAYSFIGQTQLPNPLPNEKTSILSPIGIKTSTYKYRNARVGNIFIKTGVLEKR